MVVAMYIVAGLAILWLLSKGFDGLCNLLRRSAIANLIAVIAIIVGGVWAVMAIGGVSLWPAIKWFVIIFLGFYFWGKLTE